MRSAYLICSFISALLMVPTVSAAEDLQQLQSRMKARVSNLAPLKQAQIVGENRQGYVEIVKLPEKLPASVRMTAAEIRRFVDAENADRRRVYQLLAERIEGSDPAIVGRVRARLIYQEAISEVMLQTEDGRWVSKAELGRR